MRKSKLRDDDYLMEVTLRVAVRKRDADAVIARARGLEPDDPEDNTEERKVLSAVMALVLEDVLKYDNVLEYNVSTGQRVPTVETFKDIMTMGRL